VTQYVGTALRLDCPAADARMLRSSAARSLYGY
jgi:hypothetical protein